MSIGTTISVTDQFMRLTEAGVEFYGDTLIYLDIFFKENFIPNYYPHPQKYVNWSI